MKRKFLVLLGKKDPMQDQGQGMFYICKTYKSIEVFDETVTKEEAEDFYESLENGWYVVEKARKRRDNLKKGVRL